MIMVSLIFNLELNSIPSLMKDFIKNFINYLKIIINFNNPYIIIKNIYLL